jgi:hypothetical protein
MKMVFDWEWFRRTKKEEEPTRDMLIKMAFKQYAEGNGMEKMSQPEFDGHFNTFRDAWLIATMFWKGKS